ncbi:MAG TPA: AMP-binding protein [Jatrophihabitans sp.]|jgi:amino acid adenylation domain-containing protein|uniref:AMP-binding protein n=1 Tax=Jatrophihabitans sp. TaxID=1932789 RepID=UPI002EFF4C96
MTQAKHEHRPDRWVNPLQARYWHFLECAPEHARVAHQVAMTIDCDCALDRAILDRALADIVEWHPPLSGRLLLSGAEVVAETRPVVVREAAVADATELAAVQNEHLATPLDLASGPLLSALLVTMPGRSVLTLVTHHLVCDPPSLAALVDLLAQRYELHTTGGGADAPMQPFQAGDVALKPDDGARAEELYARLRDVPLDVPLPGLRPRTAKPEYRYGCHQLDFGTELSGRVRALAQELGTTPDIVYLSAFRALLNRFARQDATLVMAELDRRPAAGEPGCWTDLAPLVLPATQELDFTRLVAETAGALDEQRDAPAVALTDLARRLQHDLAGAPGLGRVCFGSRSADRSIPVAGGTWTCQAADQPATEFDLSLVVHDGPDGCTADFRYDQAVLPDWSVSTVARSIRQLLRSAVASPTSLLSELDIIDASDRQLLLERWNGVADPVPVTEALPKVFERIAARQPDAAAVVDRGVTYSYAELNAWANRVAHALSSGGVAKADVVGLYLSRSVEWVVGYLAAYKIGAIPMALDPRAPRSRIEAATAAAPPRAIIALSASSRAEALADLDVVRVEVDSDAVAGQPSTNPDVPVGLDDLAYIVQTSGSTGRPRAVFGLHRAHAHLSLEVAAVMRIGVGSRTSWLVDAAAGISISLIWRPLASGATLCIAEDDVLVSPTRLRDWHVSNGLTHTFVTTQVAEPLTAVEWPADGALQVLEIGGEKVRRWPSAAPPFETVVAYGSNEAFLVTSMLFPWDQRVTARTATEDERRQPPPVGRPLPGVHLYVVDDDLQLLPPGVVGEVCVDTPELMLGYLGESAETARRVRPNPFGPPGSRLFLTSDIGLIRPDGMVELIGRLDDMVKVRGYRVEPALVEAILSEHPEVRRAAVVPVADAAGHNQLVACIVAETPVAPEVLRDYMTAHAPSYMVPIAYVLMDELPTGVLNKVDRKQLPPPNWREFRPRAPYRAPSTPEEVALTRIWGEVLEDVQVGVDDDLLDMGGSSLHVGRVQVRILEQLGVDLNIRQIFEASTPAALAALITQQHVQRRTPLPPVLAGRSRRPVDA